MRSLTKPTVDALEVFRTCISRVRNAALKARLVSVEPLIQAAAAAFDDAATATTLHTIPTHSDVGGVVTKEEMENVYTGRMAKEGAPGRAVYEQLLNSSPHNKCPLCGQGDVRTLDHHLPKTEYPSLTVAPANLVPACSDCNKKKLAGVPTCPEDQTLHPYYDNVEGDVWLYAEVIQTTPPGVRFYVNAPAVWGGVMAARIRNHFSVYTLDILYAANAGSELVNIRYGLTDLYSREGAHGVRIHLQRQALSYQAAHLNSWQAAMYRALTASAWFCEGGFRGE